MAKIRVHELAKEMGFSSKEMVNILLNLGLNVKNHMSTMEDTQASWVKNQIAKEQPGKAPESQSVGSEGTKSDRLARKPQPPAPGKGQKPHTVKQASPSKDSGSKKTENRSRQRINETRDMKKPPAAGEQAGYRDKPAKNVQQRDGDSKIKQGDRKLPEKTARPYKQGQNANSAQAGKNKPGKKNHHLGNNKQSFKKDYSRPQKKAKHKRKREDVNVQIPESISINDTIMVRELAEKLNTNPAEIMKKLMDLGTMATINQVIDYDTAEIVASLYDTRVERIIPEEEKILEEIVDDESSLEMRAPVVTVMGHVDHGKTSLLDKIRKADVVSGEAGGITQHIGAYQVNVNGNRITFIDTPGHEAFTAMRARGANLTDIVILVVAADDGVMPQTVEAINHIKAADVPFIVAINKIDKPQANPDRVMQQLTEYEIVSEEWGGNVIYVPVSAKSGEGIENLLEMVLLVAEMHDINANPNRMAEGVVIEGRLDKGRGAVSTVLVLKGTLEIGDYLVCGTSWCKVRAMTDYRGRRVEKAPPSMPVEITGWSDVPEAGGKVQVCDEKIAKEISSIRLSERKIEEQKQNSRVSLDDFFKHMQDSDVKELNLIIKGDVQGSIEALTQSLLRLTTDEVKIKVIHSAVGAITETDVMLASASNAIIIGFNVRPDSKARKHAEEEKIDVRLYRVIYEAIDDVKKAMVGLLDPEYKEKYLGRAEVRATFKVPNIGTVAGSYVIDGKIQRNAGVRCLRDGIIIYEGKLSSLKRFKDDVKEVVENYECGMGIKDFNDIKEGDLIEAFIMEEVPRELK